MRLKLIIAYDGAPFAGWQSQAHGRAVQDVIEAALVKITGARVVVHGSGRTDAGVHAIGQCAHIDVAEDSLGPKDWIRALNALLPPAIRVMAAQRAAADFHARFSAKGKVYRYLIRNAPVLSPHEVDRVWHFPHALDLSVLSAAARIMEGPHDFAAFTANRGVRKLETRRTIRRVNVASRGTLISVTFEGDGFLYKMVRMLTGALVRTAQGREEIESLRRRLEQGGPRWNHVAPAGGLSLIKVLY